MHLQGLRMKGFDSRRRDAQLVGFTASDFQHHPPSEGPLGIESKCGSQFVEAAHVL
jgi:hypothetical protein